MYRRLVSRFRTYRLTILYLVSITTLFVIILLLLLGLAISSISKTMATREEFFVRDLRTLTNLYDADEKFVLEKNLRKLTGVTREITPVLVPRQYYVALPNGKQTLLPRAPPRNCYVDLLTNLGPSAPTAQSPDRFCAYFTNDRTLGRYMFFNMTFADRDLATLAKGDTKFAADAVRLSVTDRDNKQVWWLYFQTPPKRSSDRHFELTAFREMPDGRRELDRRIEGWAFILPQQNATPTITLLARLDYRAVRRANAQSDSSDNWPPQDWDSIRISIGRNSASINSLTAQKIDYKPTGAIALSLASNATPIFDAHASLFIINKTGTFGESERLEIKSPSNQMNDGKERSAGRLYSGGDLLILGDPSIRKEAISDTNLSLEIQHPVTIIEESLWKPWSMVVAFLIVFACIAVYSYVRLVRPIWMMSRVINYRDQISARRGDESRETTEQPLRWWQTAINAVAMRVVPIGLKLLEDKECTIANGSLPYSNRNDEIGVLALGFNSLLEETRKQAADEKQRAKDRESSLHYIRHEVNNSLTVLINSDPEPQLRRKLLDKISYYFKKVDDRSGPEGIAIHSQENDLAAFLNEVVSEAAVSVNKVQYQGPAHGAWSVFDKFILQQAVENILINATERRDADTNIQVTLEVSPEGLAVIYISNHGPNIPENMLIEIFDKFVSTTQQGGDTGRGLGLYTARVYVKRMDGDIRAFNFNGGVTFEIALPTVRVDDSVSVAGRRSVVL